MRLGRLGHDPMARPAPITLGWVPRPKAAPDEKALQPRPAAAPSTTYVPPATPVAKPSLGRNGNNKASTLPHDWPKVIAAILAKTEWTIADLARRLGVTGSAVSNWRSGKFKPGRKVAEAIVEMYGKWVGGPLP